MNEATPNLSVIDVRLRMLEQTLEKMTLAAEARARDMERYRQEREEREREQRATFFWQSLIGPAIVGAAAIAGTHFLGK